MDVYTLESFESFLLVMVRISGFIFTAPFFNMTNTPIRVKTGLTIFLAVICYPLLNFDKVVYTGVIGYAGFVVQELMVGILIGFFANICNYILTFTGQIIDMEIGLSMVSLFDPVSKMQTTITGNLYMYFVMIMLLVTNMHHYILKAFIRAYQVIPVGGASFKPNLYVVMLKFVVDFFIIGFRIVLPIFAATLLLNVVLGILARVAPQMNMFVIGMQLKIVCGLIILFLVMILLPSVSEFIFKEIDTMMQLIIQSLSP